MCYKKWWRWECKKSKGSPIFKSQQYWGVRKNPRVLDSGLQPPSGRWDKFSFLGRDMMTSLAQEYTSRAH